MARAAVRITLRDARSHRWISISQFRTERSRRLDAVAIQRRVEALAPVARRPIDPGHGCQIRKPSAIHAARQRSAGLRLQSRAAAHIGGKCQSVAGASHSARGDREHSSIRLRPDAGGAFVNQQRERQCQAAGVSPIKFRCVKTVGPSEICVVFPNSDAPENVIVPVAYCCPAQTNS